MKRSSILLFALFLSIQHSFGQNDQGNIIYIVDSILVIEDPEEGNEITAANISDITVIKNKDSLKLLGFDKFDGVIYIFTKDYRKRPDSIKQIPSSKQMEKKNGEWFYRGNQYTGKFIDYYYSGKKQGEGVLKKGKAEGLRTMYYQNGKLSMQRNYSNGIENGLETEYYEDGSLQQKGMFINGKEDGTWEMYFPNGQVKQRSTFKDGIMEGETTVYYSTGKILAVETIKNGRTTPDKRLEKIIQVMDKGHSNYKEGDYKNAIKNYSKAIEFDSTYAEAYFSRGTVKLNNLQFDESLLDFDKALRFEPYYAEVLTNRAFARIRKFQFGSSRKLSSSNGVTVLASKDNPAIPETELAIICSDLNLAFFLGDRGKMIKEAISEFCVTKSSR